MEIKECLRTTCCNYFKYESEFKTYLEDISNFNQLPYYNLILVREACPFATHIKTAEKWERYGVLVTEPDKKIPLLVGKEMDRFYDPLSKARDRNDNTMKSERELELQVNYVYDVSATEAAITGWNTKSRKLEDKEKAYQEYCWFFHQEPDQSDRSIDDKIRDVLKAPLKLKIGQKSLSEIEKETLIEGALYALSYQLGLDCSNYELTAFQKMKTIDYTFYNTRYFASVLCHTVRAVTQLLHVCEEEVKQNELLNQMKIELHASVEQKMASQSLLQKLKTYFIPIKTKSLE